jgi:ubiquinone/menaquinone biosynthesis C-methylase UbiE
METKRILNVGCGNDLYGTDRIDMSQTKATTQVCNLEQKLPFKDQTFDEIRCYYVLEHLKNIGHFIEECYRVLKKGGILDLQTDNAGYLIFHIKTEHNKMMERKEYIKHPDDHHYHLFVPSHLKYLMKDFSKVTISYPKIKRKSWKNLLLGFLPLHMGDEGIRAIAVK